MLNILRDVNAVREIIDTFIAPLADHTHCAPITSSTWARQPLVLYLGLTNVLPENLACVYPTATRGHSVRLYYVHTYVLYNVHAQTL